MLPQQGQIDINFLQVTYFKQKILNIRDKVGGDEKKCQDIKNLSTEEKVIYFSRR